MSGRRLCCVLNIPSILMGLVILSAGTTVPDALSSILVSRQGQARLVAGCLQQQK